MRKLGSRYVLHVLLGRGTSGDVWRGTRVDDDSEVAIKVLRPELADNGAIVDRFLREYSVLLKLDGPNLVRVHDLVVDDDVLAIVMDLIDGVDLRAYLDRAGQLSPAQALDVVLGTLEALSVVHEAGVVHRDVKPENILIEGTGQGRLRAKLTDFGISTLTHSSRVSRMTDIVGTPTYMAPELAEGEPPTAASDLYAVGVVFFELLTGRPPFAGSHPIGVLRAHREDPVPPLPGLAPRIAGILGDMLAKSPRRRPPSARDAWHALVDAAEHEGRHIDLNQVLSLHASPSERGRSAPPVQHGGEARRAALTGLGLQPARDRVTQATPPLKGWNQPPDVEHTLVTSEQWAAAGVAVGATQGFWTKDGAAFVTPATAAGATPAGVDDAALTQVGGPVTLGGPLRHTGTMRPAHDDVSSTMVSRGMPVVDSSDLDTGPLPLPRSTTPSYPTGSGGGRPDEYEERRRKWIVAGATTAVLLVAGLGGWALAAEPGSDGTNPSARSTIAAGVAPGSRTTTPAGGGLMTTMIDGTMTTVPTPSASSSRRPAQTQAGPGGNPSGGSTQPTSNPAPTTSPPATSGPVPSLIGLAPAAARNKLTDAGFTGGATSELICQSGAQDNRVHTQQPAAGATASFSTTIQIKVQPDNCATVPGASGTVSATVSAIKAAGFTNVRDPGACQYGARSVSVDLAGWYVPTTTQITVSAVCNDPPPPTTAPAPTGGTRG